MGRGDDKDTTASLQPSPGAHQFPGSKSYAETVQHAEQLNLSKESPSSSSGAAKTNEDAAQSLYPKVEPSAPPMEEPSAAPAAAAAGESADSEHAPLFRGSSASQLEDSERIPPFDRATGRLDLSKYRDLSMLSAVDRVTSVPHQLKSLLWPCARIAGRALMTREELSLKTLFADLNPHISAEEKQRVKREERQRQTQRRQARSWPAQLAYFFVVGIPSALLVGLVYGALTFLGNLLRDLFTIASSAANLFRNARADLGYFRRHPDAMPTQEQAVTAITDQVVMPYARTLVHKKLPMGFMRRPADFLLNRVIRNSARASSRVLTYVSGIPAVRQAASSVKEKVAHAVNKQQQSGKKREL